jgi:sugar lactone lactonase YvrE
MYVTGANGDDINQFNLIEPWNIHNPTHITVFSVADKETAPTGLYFKSDGVSLYMIGSISDSIHQYTLSTPWDISTSTFTQSFSISAQETVPQDISFKPDGTKMYVLGSTGDDVNEYTLSIPWDISTSTFTQVSPSITQIPTPKGLFFDSDGRYCYVAGVYTPPSLAITGAPVIMQYNLE